MTGLVLSGRAMRPWRVMDPFFRRPAANHTSTTGVFVPGRLRAAQEVGFRGDDPAAVADVPHAVDPFGEVDATMEEEFHALFATLGDRLAQMALERLERGGLAATRRFATLAHIDYVEIDEIAREVLRRQTDVRVGANP